MEEQPARTGDAVLARIVRSRNHHRDGLLMGHTLPPGRRRTAVPRGSLFVRALRPVARLPGFGRAIRAFGLRGSFRDGAVVAPADRQLKVVDFRGNQKAQAHRRRKEALLGRSAVFRGIIAETAFTRDLRIEVIVRVGVRALFRRRPPWDQETRKVPVGRPHPPRQPLVGERMRSPGTNQVELQRLPQPEAHVNRSGHLPHVDSCTISAVENLLASPPGA